MNVKEHFEEYLKCLFYELTKINSKFELYLHLIKRKVDRDEVMDIAPTFFGIILESLFTDIIISLAKFYDNYNAKKKFKTKNINQFLNYVEANIKQLNIGDGINSEKVFIAEEIHEHRKSLNECERILDNIFILRDKYYAHFDNVYFFNIDDLFEKTKISINDIKMLIETGKKILNHYSNKYLNTNRSIRFSNLYDINLILDNLSDYKRIIDGFK